MARPRKNEKGKNKGRNGTGTVTKSVQKTDRGSRRLDKMCKICSECTNRSICNNRENTKACKKCKECSNKNCDIFYINVRYKAFSPQVNNSPRQYLGSFDTQKEAQEAIDKYKNGGFVEKSDLTLFQILEKKNENRLEANNIKANTDDRNKALRNKMRKFGLADKKIQKITTQDIQTFLNSLKDDFSQSEIDKQRDEIKSGFYYAKQYKLITENPCKNLISVTSSIETKKARPFEVEEQKKLLDYINTHNNLTDSRSTMDDITFRNIVKLCFASGQRIGEILALQTGYDEKHYTSDIDFLKEIFKISKTITRENNKFVLGTTTKNSAKRLRQGLSDTREISFNIGKPNKIKAIFEEQIEHSKTFTNNTRHFLFCNCNGTFITPSQVTVTFKRICRQLHIQDDNPDGCHIHQRTSFLCMSLFRGRNES